MQTRQINPAPRVLIWLYISLVLVFLYVPMIPPIIFSFAPGEVTEGRATLRWYAEMWNIRELKVPRLILMLMLLPLFIPGISMGLAIALFFRLLGLPSSLFTIAIVQI